MSGDFFSVHFLNGFITEFVFNLNKKSQALERPFCYCVGPLKNTLVLGHL